MKTTTPIQISQDLEVTGLPAFSDNYIWLIHNKQQAAVVDPGDANCVSAALESFGLALEAILITHHHPDHIGGLAQLKKEHPAAKVYGPNSPFIKAIEHPLKENDQINILGNLSLDVIEVPGHTLDHIAYRSLSGKKILFSGDTLFAGGCGRLFEGSPAQMLTSLNKLASLDEETLVYCAHEYTEANLAFAKAVEPHNDQLSARIDEVKMRREQGLATVPSSLKTEKATNPFLRSDHHDVQRAAATQSPDIPSDEANDSGQSAVDTFAAIRRWKDCF